jgi:hypothetical protein
VQVTRHGGQIARESPDGRFLYYKKSSVASSFWRMPANGGAEEKLIDAVYTRNFTVTGEGIYYARPEAPEGWSIRLFRFGSATDIRIGQYAKPPALGLSISPDRRWLLYGQVDEEGSDLMLVDDFR